ncbi:hypothetical protein C8Q75DRAFT_747235 [Abortiporus biennis]|nr:hypothetical protein C8Q75DRAFT_747235 [Abortiporus biennis]
MGPLNVTVRTNHCGYIKEHNRMNTLNYKISQGAGICYDYRDTSPSRKLRYGNRTALCNKDSE